MPRPHDVGVGTALVVLDEQGRVLLGKRRGAHAAGCWSVPGGWMDRPDTSTRETVTREAREEVGITVLACRQVGWTTEEHADLGCRTVTLYHLAEHGDWLGEPALLEPAKCERWGWFHLDNLPEPLFPGLGDVLGMLDLRAPYRLDANQHGESK